MSERPTSMAERGRQAMVAQFKAFYREENVRILEQRAGKDYYKLFVLFASWLERQAILASDLSEKARNVVIAKTLRDWDGWIVIVDRAAEDMVFETFRQADLPTIPTLSPTGESRKRGDE